MSEVSEPPSDSLDHTGRTQEAPRGLGEQPTHSRDSPQESSGARDRFRSSRKDLRDYTGLGLLVILVLVLCILTMIYGFRYVDWLNEAASAERINRSGQILIALVTAL